MRLLILKDNEKSKTVYLNNPTIQITSEKDSSGDYLNFVTCYAQSGFVEVIFSINKCYVKNFKRSMRCKIKTVECTIEDVFDKMDSIIESISDIEFSMRILRNKVIRE